MKNQEYWRKRFVQLEAAQLNKGVEFYHNLSEQYDKAAANIQKEIETFYQRFADNNKLDLLEAKKLLNSRQLEEFRWDVEEYIKKGETLNYSGEWAKQLENASIRHRITRLEAMKLQMQQQVEALMGNEVDGLDKLIRNIYEDGYYRSIFEVERGVGVALSFMRLNTDMIDKVVSKSWTADGTNFSERIWGQHRPELVQTLNTDFVRAIIRGDEPQKLINKIAKDFNVAKHKAGNVVMTESAFFASESSRKSMQELDVEYFEISAALDFDTCDDCGYREGNKIPMSDFEPGVTAPPFHPRCRCTSIPCIDEEWEKDSTRVARDEHGKIVEVPADMTYKKWREKFIQENGQEKWNAIRGGKKVLPERQKNDITKEKHELIKTLVKQNCESSNVEYIKVQKLPAKLSTDAIIERLAGADKTEGSCSSLAFAYAGNKCGLDVLDFRGGASCSIFGRMNNILEIANLPNVESQIVKTKNDFKAVAELLKTMDDGLEYYLATGKHAAVVRKNLLDYEYLELQDGINNGFKKLTNIALKKRFGCAKSHSVMGERVEKKNVLIKLDSLGQSEEFKDLLGYINTSEKNQLKGEGGYAK